MQNRQPKLTMGLEHMLKYSALLSFQSDGDESRMCGLGVEETQHSCVQDYGRCGRDCNFSPNAIDSWLSDEAGWS